MQHQRQPGPDKGAQRPASPAPARTDVRHGTGRSPRAFPGGGHEKSRWPEATGFAISVRRVSYLLVLRKVLARAASGELGYFLMSSFMRALAAAFWFILLKQMPCFR